MHKTFGKIILNNKKVCNFINSYDIIIPVPIHNKRKKERGYNQSFLIIKEFIENFSKVESNILLEENILKKVKNVSRQSLLSKEDRFSNVIGAYEFNKNKNIRGKRVLVFDDIYTTGSTVNECSRILKQAGAEYVDVFTIAKD